MEPLAFLILSNLPGQNRLKNLKYFLGIGDNVAGTDLRCQIVIPDKYQMLHHAVNISLGHNFLTLEAFQPHLVYVEANLNKFKRQTISDNYFPLAANIKYLPRIGQFFYIGRIKAVIGSGPSRELLQMKYIVNRQLFGFHSQQSSHPPQRQSQFESELASRPVDNNIDQVFNQVTLEDNDFDPYKAYQVETPPKPSISFVQKQKQQQKRVSEKSKTERLDDEDYIFEATLVLEDGMYANEPTVNLDQCPCPHDYMNQPQQKDAEQPKGSQKHKQKANSQPFSQELLMEEIRRQSKSNSQHPHNDQDIDFSMPDTIVDKEPQENPFRESPKKKEVVMKQVESRQQVGPDDDLDDMPPTIQQQQDPTPQRLKPTKTMVNVIKKDNVPKRLYNSDQISFGNSFAQQPSEGKNIENFDDLFGIQEKPQELKHHSSLPPALIKNQVEPSLGLMHVSLNQEQKSSEPEKSENGRRKRAERRDKKEETSIDNKINIVGFKPTASHRNFLKKQGFEIVSNPQNDYTILLVKEPIRLCNKLLHALLEGKRIESDMWIFNKHAQIQSKVNNLSWKQIYQKKGTHGTLLKGKGRFFISKRVEDLLEGIVEKLGGQIVDELADRKRVLNIILRAEDSMDTELYLQNRQAKKWRFYRSDLIVDTVLTGRYSVDEKYIINLFDDQ